MTDSHPQPPARDEGVRVLPPTVRDAGSRPPLRFAWYIPLIILVLAVIAATVVGFIVDRAPEPSEPSAAVGAQCRPTVDQDLSGEPWLDPDRREASEAAFATAISFEQPAFVRGEQGWHFFGDWQVQDFSQAVGRVALDDTHLASWRSYLGGLQEQATASGSDFAVVIAPAKWDVYPHLLPEWARELRGTVSLDLLYQASPEIRFIDTRAALRAASAEYPTYSPLNSHWTPYGGYVAWRAIEECLRSVDSRYADLGVPDLAGVTAGPDANEFAENGVVARDGVWTEPTFTEPLPVISDVALATDEDPTPGRSDGYVDTGSLPVRTETGDANTPLRLFMYRDSTGNALSNFAAADFAQTLQYRHSINGVPAAEATSAVLADYRPDLTLFVMTERYLSLDPPELD